ncbi:MAG: HAMP domain-containing histidine kinase [Thiothrix sp.]|nr:HAMP domain-containing histidine kinase [Thiothrix sp.]
MRRRLFLKIYLTVLGSIAILALAGFTALALLIGPEQQRRLGDQRTELIAAALPRANDPILLQDTLERLGKASGALLLLTDADGKALAAYEPAVAPEALRGRAVLPDGSVLSAQFPSPFGSRNRNPLALLAAMAVITALAAWPVVRNLTGRLERLRQGVEDWGHGNLSRRVPVEGSDEIAAVAMSFNHAAARVESLVAANRALLANASHELRSPLARLRMAIDLFEENPSSARPAEIRRNLGELDDLVGEILLSSRLESAGSSRPFEAIDLLALAAEEAARAGLEVSGDNAEVMGDVRLLTRAVRNLIQNARRHGAPPVTITVARHAGQAELSIRDHGQGIPAADAERIFDPFYRPAGHGEDAGGWGLGLALVRQIATHHHGRVSFVRPEGSGTKFVITLPLETRNTDA